MNQRKRERVSFFSSSFSAVLYITNAPSIQVIEKLLGTPVEFQLYET